MKLDFLRAFHLSILVILGISLTGCATVAMPPPTASVSTVEKLRTANLIPSNVGKFGLAPELNPTLDKTVGGLRGSSIHGADGSFSQQLREVVIVELKAAGLYDEKSPIQIEAQLSDNHVDAAIGTGTARLAAIFTVDKTGSRVFEKTLSVDSSWESSFIGAIAIPEAMNQYSSLYKALVEKLFDDKDFQTVLAR
ncbi:hypothetical protein [Sedimenticola selenatireducens]|uniref:DUF4410 domain-containing protein n=1 Tax=Sedimenticola selenatireducens TaxID=191960 RepID=A0A558DRV3_9GAMM|nr:hypothetical protein [Sedimenticola selenatireducens]TVO75783.1 hypothetical protein FHP88_07205 [Sedimenticola selenatireducens]TVT63643.1 MAG: hypothetical protein FHK78_09905 [Sedimenticola selenatireducens]